jgi:23S rRNA (adenine2503-C2)-methyltransferase
MPAPDDRPRVQGLLPEEVLERVGRPRGAATLAERFVRAVFRDRAAGFDAIRGMRAESVERLRGLFTFDTLRIADVRGSPRDRTRKFVFELPDGASIETVHIPNRDHATICLSSQVGCAYDCRFCATAQLGFRRNLEAWEIVEQVLRVQAESPGRITDVVFMGMGEPFLNYDRVLRAARILNHEQAGCIGARNITISTSGVVKAIRRFTAEGHRYRLLFSLHSADPARRAALLPALGPGHLDELLPAVAAYARSTGGRRWMTLEYTAIAGVNMGDEDVAAMRRNLTGFKYLVNVIPWNPFPGAPEEFRAPTRAEVTAFVGQLRSLGAPIKVRYSGGREIGAACGQLAFHHAVDAPQYEMPEDSPLIVL